MPLVQSFDQQKFYPNPLYYKGSGYKPLNNHYIYLEEKKGGFINLSSIVDFVNNNRDLISQIGSTVSNVAEAGKAIADTIKTSKEIELQKDIQKVKKKKNKVDKNIDLTPEETETLKSLSSPSGSGFIKF